MNPMMWAIVALALWGTARQRDHRTVGDGGGTGGGGLRDFRAATARGRNDVAVRAAFPGELDQLIRKNLPAEMLSTLDFDCALFWFARRHSIACWVRRCQRKPSWR